MSFSLPMNIALRYHAAGSLPNPVITAVASHPVVLLVKLLLQCMLGASSQTPTSLQWFLTSTHSQSILHGPVARQCADPYLYLCHCCDHGRLSWAYVPLQEGSNACKSWNLAMLMSMCCRYCTASCTHSHSSLVVALFQICVAAQ